MISCITNGSTSFCGKKKNSRPSSLMFQTPAETCRQLAFEVRDVHASALFLIQNSSHHWNQSSCRCENTLAFVFSLKKHFYFLKRIILWTQSYIISHFLQLHQKMCNALMSQPHFCSLLLLSNEIRTNSPCFAVCMLDIYCTYCKPGRRSSVSCLQLAGDGANWTKTVFHCGLTGGCESIYSLTAMRQNGLWKIETSRGLRKLEKDSAGVVSSDSEYILYNPAWFCYI